MKWFRTFPDRDKTLFCIICKKWHNPFIKYTKHLIKCLYLHPDFLMRNYPSGVTDLRKDALDIPRVFNKIPSVAKFLNGTWLTQ